MSPKWSSSRRRIVFCALAVTVPLAAACTDVGPVGATRLGAPAPRSDLVFSVGEFERRNPKSGCTTSAHRQFDFWLGRWDVTNPSGTLAGTNIVTSELGGCAVEEHWTGAAGARGRSLNFYDRETGKWYQHWVDESSLNLRLTGGLTGAAMQMSGPRTQPTGRVLIDRITWTPLVGGTVRQFWDVSLDNGATFSVVAFNGLYTPNPSVNPATPIGSASCATTPYHAADFMLGVWRVRAEPGPSIGTAVIRQDLSACLVEMTFDNGKGVASRGFLSYGRVLARWFLSSINTAGDVLRLGGPVVDNSIVLAGQKQTLDSALVDVRVTIKKLTNDEFSELFETSGDGGATWASELELRYVR